MKRLIALFQLVVFTFLLSCDSSNKPSSTSAGSGALETIPAAAEVIDLGSIEKVMVKDAQGRIVEEGNALNGLKEGAWITYNEDGVPTTLTNYHKGVKLGVELTFDNNASLSTKSYQNGDNIEGEFRKYQNRNLSEIKTYENGILNGPHLTFYTNEKVQQEVNYVNGNFDGLARWFSQDGKLTIAYVYDDGELVDKNPNLSAQDSVASY